MPRAIPLVLLAGVLSGGCGGAPARGAAPASPAATCASAAGQVGDLLASSQDPRPPDEAVNQVIGRIRAACEEDAWSAGARACFAAMASPADADHCGTLLTEAQTQGLLRRQEAAERAAGGRPGGATGGGGGSAGGSPSPPPPPPPRTAPPGPVNDSADPCDGGE